MRAQRQFGAPAQYHNYGGVRNTGLGMLERRGRDPGAFEYQRHRHRELAQQPRKTGQRAHPLGSVRSSDIGRAAVRYSLTRSLGIGYTKIHSLQVSGQSIWNVNATNAAVSPRSDAALRLGRDDCRGTYRGVREQSSVAANERCYGWWRCHGMGFRTQGRLRRPLAGQAAPVRA